MTFSAQLVNRKLAESSQNLYSHLKIHFWLIIIQLTLKLQDTHLDRLKPFNTKSVTHTPNKIIVKVPLCGTPLPLRSILSKPRWAIAHFAHLIIKKFEELWWHVKMIWKKFERDHPYITSAPFWTFSDKPSHSYCISIHCITQYYA